MLNLPVISLLLGQTEGRTDSAILHGGVDQRRAALVNLSSTRSMDLSVLQLLISKVFDASSILCAVEFPLHDLVTSGQSQDSISSLLSDHSIPPARLPFLGSIRRDTGMRKPLDSLFHNSCLE